MKLLFESGIFPQKKAFRPSDIIRRVPCEIWKWKLLLHGELMNGYIGLKVNLSCYLYFGVKHYTLRLEHSLAHLFGIQSDRPIGGLVPESDCFDRKLCTDLVPSRIDFQQK